MRQKKKLRVSLLIQIAVFFLVSSIISITVTLHASRDYLVKIAVSSSTQIADAAAAGAIDYIKSSSGDISMFRSATIRDSVHDIFRNLCIKSHLKYLYLYYLDDNNVRHYLIGAGGNDDEDAYILKNQPYEMTDDSPLHQCELDVVLGNKRRGYEFIDNDYGSVCMWIYPVTDENGRVYALLGADYSMKYISNLIGIYSGIIGRITAIMMCITFLGFIFLVRILALSPLKALSGRMKVFVKNGTTKHKKRRTLFRNEITDIEESFDAMTGDIINYIGEIKDMTEQRVHDQTQMEAARSIQCGIVPERMSFCGIRYTAAGYSFPAKDVCGDFYDIFKLDNRRVCFVIGDISGKGITAALFMMMVKSTIREGIRLGDSLEVTLNKANNEICALNPECMFATVFAAILDVHTGELTYCNAGHNPPVVIGEKSYFMDVDPGLVIGLFEDADLKEEHIILEKGQGLFIYTDGITETVNRNDEQYGNDRLLKLLQEKYDNNKCIVPEKTISSLEEAVREFSEGQEQFDDITSILLMFEGEPEDVSMLSIGSLNFSNIKEIILDSYDDLEKAKIAVLACEEIFTNICEYSKATEISFAWIKSNNGFRAVFFDNGIAFDPVSFSSEQKDFDDLDSGGMGITLIKKNTTSMHYDRKNDRNVLTLLFEA